MPYVNDVYLDDYLNPDGNEKVGKILEKINMNEDISCADANTLLHLIWELHSAYVTQSYKFIDLRSRIVSNLNSDT